MYMYVKINAKEAMNFIDSKLDNSTGGIGVRRKGKSYNFINNLKKYIILTLKRDRSVSLS